MFNNTKEPMVKHQVHTTTDYFLFRSIEGNRNKNLMHINRLRDSMNENYLFTIIIVEKMIQYNPNNSYQFNSNVAAAAGSMGLTINVVAGIGSIGLGINVAADVGSIGLGINVVAGVGSIGF